MGSQPPRQRRAPAQGPPPARLPRLRRRRTPSAAWGTPGSVDAEADPGPGPVPPRRPQAQRRPGQLPRSSAPTRPTRTAGTTGLRGHEPRVGRRDLSQRRPRRRRRPGHGDALRAPVPGLARGVSADRSARVLLVLRGVHPHHRLHVQPARQVARVVPEDPLAAAGRVAELPAHLARLAAGPQRLQPPGPRLHRPRRQQEGHRRPGLPPARRQHAALGDRPLPEEPAITSTSWSPASSRARSGSTWTRPSSTARPGSGSGSGRATTRAAIPTS